MINHFVLSLGSKEHCGWKEFPHCDKAISIHYIIYIIILRFMKKILGNKLVLWEWIAKKNPRQHHYLLIVQLKRSGRLGIRLEKS